MDGDAISASRFNTGTYFVTFPPPIDKCAASVVSATFAESGFSSYRVWAQVGIASALGGGFDASQVLVNTFGSDTGNVDTAFTLTLVCPH